jgi:hypothetical protein
MKLGRRCIDSVFAQFLRYRLDFGFRVDAETEVVQSS